MKNSYNMGFKMSLPILLLLICALVLTHKNTKAQSLASYLMQKKNNHFIPVPVVQDTFDFILAGTEADFDGSVRVMRVNSIGNIVGVSKLISEGDHLKKVVDLTEMEGLYYITCLRRADPNNNSDKDMIEVIGMDENCNSIGVDFYVTDIPEDWALTPVHTMAFNGYLYICGYATNMIDNPLIVDYTTRKMAFVLRVNPNAPSTGAVGVYIDTRPLNGSGNPLNTGVDYDMAVRVIPVDPTNPNTEFYVTGSSNIIRLASPIGTPTEVFTSGILNIQLNNSLGTMPALFNQPLASPFGPAERGEYGQSMVIVAGQYMIAANDFLATSPDFPKSYRHHFTAVDPSIGNLYPLNNIGIPPFISTTARWSDYSFHEAWGLQTLPSHYPQGNPNPDNVVLAGMVRSVTPTCSIPTSVTNDNYNPFTADYTLGVTGGNTISVTRNFVNLYTSNVGTGLNTLANSYNADWKWTFNNSWAPNLAAQRPAGYQYPALALTAPYWNNTYNQLNFKFIQADEFGNDFDGCATSVDCIPNSSYIEPVQVCVGPVTTTLYTIEPNILTAFEPQTGAVYNEWVDDNLNIIYCDPGYWKPITSTIKATLGPNPAKDKINVTVEGLATNIKIELIDIYGRIVANLFEGEVSKLKVPLSLPQINAGLYFAKIKADNKLLPIQKIIIY